jgi:hypothetical protein
LAASGRRNLLVAGTTIKPIVLPSAFSEIQSIRDARFIAAMLPTQIVSEISYSPNLEATFEFILGNSSISDSRDRPSFPFITTARFLKNNAPYLFQIREMGAEPENHMDRWLWDLLKHPD